MRSDSCCTSPTTTTVGSGPVAGAYDYLAARPDPDPVSVARRYAMAGESDLTFMWLEKAFDVRKPQLLHVAGLSWSGYLGVQRKTAGAAQALDSSEKMAAMGLSGLGGLLAIIGGLLFLVVCWRSMRPAR